MGPLFADKYAVWEQLLRILIAAVVGFCIGLERKTRSKEAGTRTHTIVCMASCLMMIISKYGFEDVGSVDASRMASQIVTGIGFLGAGMIFYRRDALKGLTTAAGMWATCGIGMAIGAGMYAIGVASAAFLVLLQIILHTKIKLFAHRLISTVRVITTMDDGVVDKVTALLGVKKYLKVKTSMKDGSRPTLELECVTDKVFTAQEILRLSAENDFILSIEKDEEL